jgi:uncharacterized protein
MIPPKIKKVVWDNRNIQHIARHGIVPTEVGFALQDPMVKFLSTYNGRALVLGRSGKRFLAAVLNEEKPGSFYVITARDMSKKERRFYRK